MIYKFFIFFFLALTGFTALAQNDPVQVPEEIVEIESKLIEASGLTVKGDVPGAIKIYEGLLSTDPSNSAAAYSLGKLYIESNTDLALKYMQQAYRHDAENDYIAQALADLYVEADRNIQAAEIYAKLFKKFPSRENFLLEQTHLLSQAGKTRDALRAIEQHLVQGGRLSPYIGQQRFTLAVSMNDSKAAIKALEELMDTYPNNPKYYQELAQFYRRTGDEASAKMIWKDMQERFPNDKRATIGLAGQSKLTTEEGKFIERLEPIFEDPTLDVDSKILQLMPIVQEVANRNDTVLANRTIGLAETLTKVHPDEAKSYSIYGDLLYYAARNDEAIEAYKKTIEINPSVYAVWEQLLLSIAESGDNEALLQESEKALNLFPNQARLYYFNGRALARTGDFQGAESTLQQGAMMAFKNLVLLYDINEARAFLFLQQGKYDAAQKACSEALRIRPKYGVALALQAEIQLRTDKLDQGAQSLTQAVSELPQHPYVITIEALSKILNADISYAKSNMDMAYKYGADNWAIAHEISGDIAFLGGQEEEAKILWNKAQKMGGGSALLNKKINTGTYLK